MTLDVSHFDTLCQLLELERREERRRFEAAKAELSLAEREALGQCLLDLEAFDEAFAVGGRVVVSLAKEDKRPFVARLSPGDLVELRPGRGESLQPAQGVVWRSTRTWVEVAFDKAPPHFVVSGRVRLDLTWNDVTYDRARGAVEKVRSMDRGRERRKRSVLLGEEPPRFETPQALETEERLNPEQREAVARALAAEDVFLVHGPPGTGKSHVLGEVARTAVAQGKRVLATAASNAAVDHLLEVCLTKGLLALRVGHPARVLPKLVEHTLDARVESHPDFQLARDLFEEAYGLYGYARRQRAQGRRPERFERARRSQTEGRALLSEAKALEKRAVESLVDRAEVVCATLSALEGGVLCDRAFDLVLLDEATQATEPLSLLAFLKAPTCILAGDPKQLSPTVLSLEAQQRGLATSLFERLAADHGNTCVTMLCEQYRMNEEIMSFPSAEMYGGLLRAHPSVRARRLGDLLGGEHRLELLPVVFLDTAGKGLDDSVAPHTESHFNEGEAELVVQRANELLRAGLSPHELALIAPYSAQAFLLRQKLPDERVEIDTVDAFQGREKEAVLLSLTRSNPAGSLGFLKDVRRLNVALTRPRRHLFIVGDSATVGGDPFFSRLIASVERSGGYRSVWDM